MVFSCRTSSSRCRSSFHICGLRQASLIFSFFKVFFFLVQFQFLSGRYSSFICIWFTRSCWNLHRNTTCLYCDKVTMTYVVLDTVSLFHTMAINCYSRTSTSAYQPLTRPLHWQIIIKLHLWSNKRFVN